MLQGKTGKVAAAAAAAAVAATSAPASASAAGRSRRASTARKGKMAARSWNLQRAPNDKKGSKYAQVRGLSNMRA